MGPKVFHVVLYEYLSVFFNTPYKNSTLSEMKKIFMVLKLSTQENPQRAEKKFQKITYRTKNGSKNVI